MNIGGIIGGTIAAIIGAAAWAALAFFGGIEVAYLALGIGFIVGLGVSAGSKSGGFGAAIVAVVLTVLSLVGGKYAAVALAVNEMDSQLPAFEMKDDGVKMRIANISIKDSGQDPATLNYRNGKDYTNAESLNDLPADIAMNAQKEFDLLTEDEVDGIKEEAEAEYHEFVSTLEAKITEKAFMDSFSPFDILFFLLAIITAGKIALSDVVDGGG